MGRPNPLSEGLTFSYFAEGCMEGCMRDEYCGYLPQVNYIALSEMGRQNSRSTAVGQAQYQHVL